MACGRAKLTEGKIRSFGRRALETRDIARQLHMSLKTVETHRANIATKLEIRDTAGLVKYAIRKGLVKI